MERVITFFCPTCKKAYVSETTFDQPCPSGCGTTVSDPRELRADPADAIAAHQANPKSLAQGPDWEPEKVKVI